VFKGHELELLSLNPEAETAVGTVPAVVPHHEQMARWNFEFSSSFEGAGGILGTAAYGRRFEDAVGASYPSLFLKLPGFCFPLEVEPNRIPRLDEAFRLLYAVEVDARVLDSNSIAGKSDDALDEVDVAALRIGENRDLAALVLFANFRRKHVVARDERREHP